MNWWISNSALIGSFQLWAWTHRPFHHKQWYVSSVWSASKLFKPSAHKRLSDLCTYIPYSGIYGHYQLLMFVLAVVQMWSVLVQLLVISQCLKKTFIKRKGRENLVGGWERVISGYPPHRYLSPGSRNSQQFCVGFLIITSVFDASQLPNLLSPALL